VTNVSKRQLKKEIYSRIQKQFFSILGDLKNSNSAEYFTEGFFTESEETMFYKRLAIILMLDKGVPPTTVHRTLKVSQATVFKIAKILDKGGYADILKSTKKKNVKEGDFAIDLEVLLRMGMPPIVGKGRWKFLDDYLEKKKSKK
jgi:uncharacterized protein YerC